MGLGLYIAQAIAHAHGTAIRVDSIPLGYGVTGVDQARNIFSFKIKDVQHNSSQKR